MRRPSVLSLLALVAVAGEASAQPAVGPEFQVNTYTTSDQYSPAVAADADGNFVVVWTSRDQDFNYGVFGQRFDRLGNPLGREFAINTSRTRQDDNSQIDTGFFPITAGPHFVEVRWERATAPGANDGLLELWIDDALRASLTTVDNDAAAVDFVRMGGLSLKTGASGTLRFDEFESRRETHIGP